MILGDGPEEEGEEVRSPATKRMSVVDLRQPSPHFERAESLNHERMHVNAVLLPDRTVLAVGGGVTREGTTQPRQVQPGGMLPNDVNEVFKAEIYEPERHIWTRTAPAT